MEAKRYMERINYVGEENCDMSTLASLQERHLFSVPFENIDIQTGIPIELDTARFYNKIVVDGRGGYCYEMNGLFHHLLQRLGYDAYLISARVIKGKNYGPEFDHLAIIVNLDEKQWLIDVGYGDFAFKPLLIEPGTIQFDGRNHYKIMDNLVVDGIKYLSVGKWSQRKNAYIPAYCFTLTPRKLSDFAPMNHYQQTSPKSHFTQNFICSIPTPQGRISLINNRLVFSTGVVKKEMRISHEKIYHALEEHFGIGKHVVAEVPAMRYAEISAVD